MIFSYFIIAFFCFYWSLTNRSCILTLFFIFFFWFIVYLFDFCWESFWKIPNGVFLYSPMNDNLISCFTCKYHCNRYIVGWISWRDGLTMLLLLILMYCQLHCLMTGFMGLFQMVVGGSQKYELYYYIENSQAFGAKEEERSCYINQV